MAGKTTVYHLTARQIILLAMAAALIAVGATALLLGLNTLWNNFGSSGVSFAENAPTGISDPATVSDEQNSIDVYKSISPGVAFINTTTYNQGFWGGVQEGKGNGSGSVIDARGYILTNNHVVENAQKVTVNFGGDKAYPASVVGRDPDTDLAVIKIEPPAGGLTVVPMADSDQLMVGQKVLAIGNPFGLDRTLTTGVISGLQRPIRARNNRPIDAAIQTDASINPGNSGGPLLDKFGRMIGINSQILSPAGGSVGVGFAVPVNTAKRVVPQLIQNGEVRRAQIGVRGLSIAELRQRGSLDIPLQKGFLLYELVEGGPAAAAGLRGISRDTDGELVL
ncbi:MAG: trypsin-like peptidase domain-containing protein, partial [Acidobacteria bacterium]|nr:trypsin-like peptidase domain-containing protein [Acidobacteriota bacterium]